MVKPNQKPSPLTPLAALRRLLTRQRFWNRCHHFPFTYGKHPTGSLDTNLNVLTAHPPRFVQMINFGHILPLFSTLQRILLLVAVGHPLNMCYLIAELVNNVNSVGWMEKDLRVSVRGRKLHLPELKRHPVFLLSWPAYINCIAACAMISWNLRNKESKTNPPFLHLLTSGICHIDSSLTGTVYKVLQGQSDWQSKEPVSGPCWDPLTPTWHRSSPLPCTVVKRNCWNISELPHVLPSLALSANIGNPSFRSADMPYYAPSSGSQFPISVRKAGLSHHV